MAIALSEHFNYKKLLRFVAPTIVMMVFTSIYSIVDGLFISNFVGEGAVTAINFIFPLIMVLGSIGFMLGAGGSALVSKVLGEGDEKKANEYFSLLVYFTAAVGLIIMAVGQAVIPQCAVLLCGESEGIIYDYCVIYGRILLAGQPFFILQNIFQSFFVTAEKPRLGLVTVAAAGILNMVLDAAFVAGAGWGLEGAGWATTSSEILGGLAPVFYFARKNKSLLRLTRTRFYFKAILKSATNGSSEFLSNVASSVIIMLYNFQLKNLAPDGGVAAYGAIGYVAMIFFSVFMGFGVGIVPLIGYNYGAENKAELRNLYRKGLIITAISGVLMTVLSEALAEPLVGMFGYSEELRAMTLHGYRIFSLSYILLGFGTFGSALFTALNNGLISAVISFARTLVFRLVAVMVLPLFWGLDGVWTSACVSEIVSFVMTFALIIAYGRSYGYSDTGFSRAKS